MSGDVGGYGAAPRVRLDRASVGRGRRRRRVVEPG